jgi:hypothetical protein
VSRFGRKKGESYGQKKQTLIERLTAFFERFKDISPRQEE